MKGFKYIDPPQDLEASILNIIMKERHKKAVFRLVSLGTLSLTSFYGLIEASLYLWESFRQTGFYEYLSLIFSDGSILTTYWKEFAFSLVESLPLLGLIILLSTTTIFIWSSTKALKDMRLVFLQT